MGDIVGTGGNYSGPSKIAGTILSWEANWNIGQFDTTPLNATDGAKSSANVTKQLSGSATLLMSDANTLPVSLSDFAGSVVLTVASGKTYSFTGNFSNVRIARPIEAGIMTASFISSGAIT